ncbi:unnamed protein product [Dovyalis caffra]|uniref:22alpha-hydroxysteroid 23-monooxygenase n=1 Tax=Dovyalis caffra TaxID=77055 RepID=A0AAV1SUZ5_9ROSI|nr:unnamed protein product [Dovyalis caffra]
MNVEGGSPKLFKNKPKKAQLKAKDLSSPPPPPQPTTGTSSSAEAAAAASYKMGSTAPPPPPPPPQPPKESFARRYKFLWPLLLTVNLAVGVTELVINYEAVGGSALASLMGIPFDANFMDALGVSLDAMLHQAVETYLFMRTKKKDTDIEEEVSSNVPSTSVSSSPSTTAPVSEEPIPLPTVSQVVKLREPIPENQQRELFKWILEEKRKVKPKDSEEKKRIDEEKAILKQFIRAKSIPSIYMLNADALTVLIVPLLDEFSADLIIVSRLDMVVVFGTPAAPAKKGRPKPLCPRDHYGLSTLGWPFIGETIDFVSCAYSDRPESFMDKRRRMYGKVFKSHIFGSRTIVSTDAEVSKFILQSDAKVFVPSYPKSLTELMGKSSILLINGSLQRRIHGLIGAFFKSPHLKAQITRDMQSYVQESMEKWREDQPIYIQDESKNIAFQVLVKALISLDPGEDMELLKKQFQEFIAGLMSLPLNIPGSQLYRSLQAKKKMVKLVQKIIQSKRDGISGIISMAPKDVAEVLLNDASEQLTDDLIADNMIDMMIPGEDSVPVLMTLAVKYLSDCPAALQQLTEENMKLKCLKAQHGEPMCWSDYLSLPFTQTVITETLRMGNIIIGVMRKAMKDIEIKGYLIPKGWCAFAYFRSVHLDENNYEWPYQFNPWRWQEKDMSNSSFTPFGGGQRLCPGLDLARLEASIFLHHFVTQFRWVAEEDTIVNFPTVRMKRRMPIWVKRREEN